MGIGHVQGLSRVRPDHSEEGAGEELYSEGLWSIRNLEPRTLNFEPRTLKAQSKLPKASSKPP